VKRRRIDRVLVERGFCETREKARRALMAGEVFVGTERVLKGSRLVSPDEEGVIALAKKDHAVSRAYYKLEKAFEVFSLSAEGRAALDVGSSTGGFTQSLLEHGARLVYAVDCGTNQLAYSLRRDPRVVVMEKTNARFLTRTDTERAYRSPPRGGAQSQSGEIPLPDLAVMDVSFISSALILPQLVREFPLRDIVLLVKPQFEAGREEVGSGGIVRDASVHSAVLRRVALLAAELEYSVSGLSYSPLRGSEGNIEFLALLRSLAHSPAGADDTAIERIVREAHENL